MQIELSGKNALVTGATGGLGSSIASALVESGARVILSGTRESKLNELDEQLGKKGEVYPIPCNLDSNEQINSLAERAVKQFGTIDILINNAGITLDNLFLRMKPEDIERVLQVNLLSAMYLSKALIKTMIRNKYGRIINITSVVGYTGNPGQTNYSASKSGLVGFTKSLAMEVASRNITVNCLAPGFISSEMTDKLNEEQKNTITKSIPIGRIGRPDEVASGIVYLASEQAGYITGQTLHVNGGLAMV